jgi:hypothetical protein
MTRAISRDSFNELKQYLGVYLQQGRVILDSDWNEAQDILGSLVRRVGQDAFRDGIVNEGFEIQPVLPPHWPNAQISWLMGQYLAGLPVILRFGGGTILDSFENLDGWALSSTQGKLRLGRDRPYEGKSFMRVSDHTGTVQVTKTLATPMDLSASMFASYRMRINQTLAAAPSPPANFFIEDSSGNRSIYRMAGTTNSRDQWMMAGAVPLDLRFQVVDLDLFSAYRGLLYTTPFVTMSPPGTLTWTVSAGALPPGTALNPLPAPGPIVASPGAIYLTGTPTTVGVFNFTITATSGSSSASRAFTLRVQDTPLVYPQPWDLSRAADLANFWVVDNGMGIRSMVSKGASGLPANPGAIKKYGFEVTQQSAPIVWDFDVLRVAGRDTVNQLAGNNFVIHGGVARWLTELGLQMRVLSPVYDTQDFGSMVGALERNPRAYVGGLVASQPRDVLYSDQADPNDPALTTPTGTAIRKDTVYLDVWKEPVTYVEDPDIREIALGGPDTATRSRVRQRVRVNQGGLMPTGDGTGLGTLATEGTYTDKANRLFLVEVDTAGDLGTATFRWSEDNGSTIQRVIEDAPAGSNKLKVEDASAFQPGDFILVRKEFGDEEHRIAGIFGNTITLQATVGAQLATLPAASRPGFTSFLLGDRPKVQRWNQFHSPITLDPNDSTVSAALNLSYGVKVRFGGRSLKKGDYWTFRARYLAGDEASAVNAVTRIEQVDFQRPQGPLHQYLPLATLFRDPTAHEPTRIKMVRDLRPRGGSVVAYAATTPTNSITITGTTAVMVGGIDLGLTNDRSTFLCTWQGFISAPANTLLRAEVRFYGNDMTDPSLNNNGLVSGSDPVWTSVFIESAGNRNRTIVVHQPSNTNLPVNEIVAARLFISLQTGTTATIQSLGKLSIVETKNRILITPDFS